MHTQCNDQMASHITTYLIQYILLKDLSPRLPFRKFLPSLMDIQRPIQPPTLSCISFQEIQCIKIKLNLQRLPFRNSYQVKWINSISFHYLPKVQHSNRRLCPFIAIVGVSLTDIHHETQTQNLDIKPYQMRDTHLPRMRSFSQLFNGFPNSYIDIVQG